MKIRFEVTSIQGIGSWGKEISSEEEFNNLLWNQVQHYEELAETDSSLSVTVILVKDGKEIYRNEIVKGEITNEEKVQDQKRFTTLVVRRNHCNITCDSKHLPVGRTIWIERRCDQ